MESSAPFVSDKQSSRYAQERPIAIEAPAPSDIKFILGDVVKNNLEARLMKVLLLGLTHSAAPQLESLSAIKDKIDALFADDEDAPPTQEAHVNARTIVESSYRLAWAGYPMTGEVPPPVISTDSVGGIRMAWQSGNKHLRANFGAAPDLRSYLYFESGDNFGIEDLDATKLSERLSWLVAK